MQRSMLIWLPGAKGSPPSPSFCAVPAPAWAIPACIMGRKLTLLPSSPTEKAKTPVSSAKHCWTSLKLGTVPLRIIHTEGKRSKLNQRVQYGRENCPKYRKLLPIAPRLWVRLVTPSKCHASAMWLEHAVLCITQSTRRIKKPQKQEITLISRIY